jgi:hypothetical protein
MKTFLTYGVTTVVVLLLLAFGVLQIYAGFIGLNHQFGFWWAVAGMLVFVIFQNGLPLTVGGFLAAWNVWGWHWSLAALFAAPTLLLILPGAAATLLDRAKTWLSRST